MQFLKQYLKWIVAGILVVVLAFVGYKFFAKDKAAEIYDTTGEKKITTTIYVSELNEKMKNISKDFIAQNGEYEVQKRILDSMIERELLFKDLKKNKFSEEPVMKQWESQKKEVLVFYFAQEYIANEKKIKIPETDMKAYYEKEKERFKVEEQVQVSHILVKVGQIRNEADAKTLITKIMAELKSDGSNFAELARKYSEDASSQQGGDIGYFGRGRMVPEFETAAFALKKGEISKEPLKTQFGYHILYATDRIEAGYKAYEDVKKDLRSPVYAEILKKEYDIVVYPEKIDIKNKDVVIGEVKKINKAYTLNTLKELLLKTYPDTQMIDTYFSSPEYVASVLNQILLVDVLELKIKEFNFENDKAFKTFEAEEYKNYIVGYYQNELMKKITVTDEEARQAYMGNAAFLDSLVKKFGPAIKTSQSFREQKEKEFLPYVKQQLAAGKQQEFYSNYIAGLKQEYSVVIFLKEPPKKDIKKEVKKNGK